MSDVETQLELLIEAAGRFEAWMAKIDALLMNHAFVDLPGESDTETLFSNSGTEVSIVGEAGHYQLRCKQTTGQIKYFDAGATLTRAREEQRKRVEVLDRYHGYRHPVKPV